MCPRICLCVVYAWRSVYKGLCVSDYLLTHVCVSIYTSITCAPAPPRPGELTDADHRHGGPRACSGHLQGQKPAPRVMSCRLPSSFFHLVPSVFTPTFRPGHSLLLVGSSSCLILGFWKWERGLACSCAPPAVTPRGGPGVVRWGRSPNLHLPEEAGSREHPRLTSVTRGTRVQGTAGARQAPCLPSRGPGTAVQLSATVAWLPQRWGPVGGAGGLAIAFRLSLLLLF